jgi:hypothetical protein
MKKIVLSGFLFFMAFSFTYSQMTLSNAEAMFIYSFTRNIEWNSDSKEFNIYVIGTYDNYNDLVGFTSHKLVGQKKINVIRVKSVNEINSDCDILFLAHGYASKIEGFADKFKNSITLIITENDNAIAKGASINFVLVDG